MNFQDLFARYREMGAMAPQQSFDEQLFTRNQNGPQHGPSNSWTVSSDPLNMDLPSPTENNYNNSNEAAKKERLMFKLPSPSTFRPFLMSMDEEHKQGLSGDEEVENLLQPRAPQLQQGWNLALLKTNSLCKDYYKLTSNMLHTLIIGIRELTDGDISPAWKIAQDRGYQKRSNFSNLFLQDVGNKPVATIEPNHVSCTGGGSVEEARNTQPSMEVESKDQSPLKLTPNNIGGQAPAPRESLERSKDIDGILELRKLLWRQIVPTKQIDPMQDGEKKMKLLQESRMKVVNVVGFGVNSDNYNCTLPESCQASFKTSLQHVAANESTQQVHLSLGTSSPKLDEQREKGPHKNSRRVEGTREGMKSKFSKEDTVLDEELHDTSRPDQEGQDREPVETEYSVSFPEEDGDVHLEEEYASFRKRNDTQPLKRSKFSESTGPKDKQPKSSRSNFHSKETRFSVGGQILPIFDDEEDFEIVEEEKENPSRYPNDNFVSCRRGGNDSAQNDLVDRHFQVVNRNSKDVRQRGDIQYNDTLTPPKCNTRSWCIVGGFSSRSQIASRSKHIQSQKPGKRLQV